MSEVTYPTLSEQLLPSTAKMGQVHLAVTEPANALKIWRDVVGLEVIEQNDEIICLGVGQKALIVLYPGASGPVMERSLGLYHVAIHVPERRDLAHFMIRAMEAGVRISPTDHLVSEAIYLWDFDGNGIEITFETPWRGRLAEAGSGEYVITADGQPHSGREPIEVEGLLHEAQSSPDPRAPMPEATRIGHVHLHATSLQDSMDFYRDVIGFGELSMLSNWGMADAGLGYAPHAIAFNIWAGRSAKQPPEGVSGLRHFTLTLPDDKAMSALSERLERHNVKTVALGNGGIAVHDPSGNRLHIELFA